MTGKEKNDLISFLKEDEIKNINLLNFMEAYPVVSLERVGDSVLMRGKSDCLWTYLSSPNEKDLEGVLARLTPDDRTFAAIEDWMLPALTRGRKLSWHLSMIRLILPEEHALPKKPLPHIAPLSPDEGDYIYRHSLYQRLTNPDYIRGCIRQGPSAGIRESGELVAWLMTQDDGSLGVLHVLDGHRGKGYAYDLTVHLAERIRATGRIPFVHVEETNAKSMSLALKVGFRQDRRLHWLKIEPEGASAGSGDYC